MITTASISQLGLGAALAASIAGIFSTLGLIISKEQKISDFRREWIEDLRVGIASFMGNANLFLSLHEYSTDDLTNSEVLKMFREEIVAMYAASSRVRLKLDKNDPLAAPVLEAMRAIEALTRNPTSPSIEQIADHEEELVRHSRVLMRREWKRVREGEAVYRTAKFLAMGIALAGMTGGFAYMMTR